MFGSIKKLNSYLNVKGVIGNSFAMSSVKRKCSDSNANFIQSKLSFKRLKTTEPSSSDTPDLTVSTENAEVKKEESFQEEVAKTEFPLSPKANLSNLSVSSPSIEEKRVAAKMKLIEKKTMGIVSNMGLTWFRALESEFTKPYFESLCKFINEERKSNEVYPPLEEIFTWTRITPIDKVSTVIVGQDPYHGPKQAHGLCFSVPKSVQTPPSLENMYKELTSSMPGFSHPGHGNLIGWAEQGILLLNSVLTVRKHAANSHKDKGWEQFTDAVMSWFNKNTSGTVFILWGAYAQKKGQRIDKNKHHVLQGVHPSPLSAHRGFFGCGHFKMCNQFLKEEGKQEIDWNHLP